MVASHAGIARFALPLTLGEPPADVVTQQRVIPLAGGARAVRPAAVTLPCLTWPGAGGPAAPARRIPGPPAAGDDADPILPGPRAAGLLWQAPLW